MTRQTTTEPTTAQAAADAAASELQQAETAQANEQQRLAGARDALEALNERIRRSTNDAEVKALAHDRAEAVALVESYKTRHEAAIAAVASAERQLTDAQFASYRNQSESMVAKARKLDADAMVAIKAAVAKLYETAVTIEDLRGEAARLDHNVRVAAASPREPHFADPAYGLELARLHQVSDVLARLAQEEYTRATVSIHARRSATQAANQARE